ncbi:MAG: hypothetical protein JNK48_04870 [Bryobacterales bacterium]|nr:hypothetical protein [Bryobacterales bacterium]
MCWRWLIAVALSTFVCLPQEFTNLRGTRDGALFFLTAAQPMDLGLITIPRIFVLDNSGVRPFPGTEQAEDFDLSDDGGVLVLYRAGESIVLNASGAEYMRLEGRAQISPNGRFLALQSASSVSLVDVLSKQTLRTAEAMNLLPGKAISSTGAIAAVDANRQIQIIRPDSISPSGLPAIIGNQPNAILHIDSSGRSLAAYMNSAIHIKVLTAPTTLQVPTSSVRAILRFDNRSLQLLTSAGIQSLPLDGGPSEMVIAQSGLTQAALAGPERYFYIVSGILVSRYARSVPIEVIRNLSFFASAGETLPGTVFEWRIPQQSNWLTVTATPPYPTSLNGYRVLLNGRPAPIVALTTLPGSRFQIFSHAIRFLVPWSLPLTGDITTVSLALNTPVGVVFSTTPVRLYVRKTNPRFERATHTSAITTQFRARAYHQEGTELSPASPAVVNELIAVRMRGLGPLTSLPPDDRPPSTSIPIASKLECTISDGIDARPLTLESAALSITQSDIYDITFRIPAMNPRGELHLSCELAGFGDSAAIPVRSQP